MANTIKMQIKSGLTYQLQTQHQVANTLRMGLFKY